MYDPYYDARIASAIVQHALLVDAGNHVTLTAEKARALAVSFDVVIKRVEECEEALRKIEGILQPADQPMNRTLQTTPSALAHSVALFAQEFRRLQAAAQKK